ncbi:uncharacterized protein LOC124456711 [Xenia sp. Carnegie-2017]|uniref:uncharacterized protein LOC124456711 n=1 Tax=Xenia sp. Carnegie-2017 TaxID=2897299 RepID=UPI001F04598C|nr:uncharacterized protein LOC124456711 [Xenia sp. Carnegie-2017]
MAAARGGEASSFNCSQFSCLIGQDSRFSSACKENLIHCEVSNLSIASHEKKDDEIWTLRLESSEKDHEIWTLRLELSTMKLQLSKQNDENRRLKLQNSEKDNEIRSLKEELKEYREKDRNVPDKRVQVKKASGGQETLKEAPLSKEETGELHRDPTLSRDEQKSPKKAIQVCNEKMKILRQRQFVNSSQQQGNILTSQL